MVSLVLLFLTGSMQRARAHVDFAWCFAALFYPGSGAPDARGCDMTSARRIAALSLRVDRDTEPPCACCADSA